jgi:hypothetical protein
MISFKPGNCVGVLQVLLLVGGDVVERCMAMVRQLKGITATYRMTAKGPPVRHSHYVVGETLLQAALLQEQLREELHQRTCSSLVVVGRAAALWGLCC